MKSGQKKENNNVLMVYIIDYFDVLFFFLTKFFIDILYL